MLERYLAARHKELKHGAAAHAKKQTNRNKDWAALAHNAESNPAHADFMTWTEESFGMTEHARNFNLVTSSDFTAPPGLPKEFGGGSFGGTD